MSIIDTILNVFTDPIRGARIPESTFIVIGFALLLSLITTSANRFLVNYKMVANYRREYMGWTQAVKKARKENDEKQLDKLMKRQAAVMKMSSRATLEQMKTTAITFIPLLLLYNVLLGAFGLHAVAYSPFWVPGATVSFDVIKTGTAVFSTVYWYFLCSFAISIPMSRLFGVQTFSMTPGDSK